MIRNRRILGISAVLAGVAGAGLAFANAEPARAPVPGTAATSISTPAATSRPGTGTVVRTPLQRIEALTDEECEGLGGVVQNDRACATGRTCATSSRSGVVRYVCITKN